jgi:hypothetical protein
MVSEYGECTCWKAIKIIFIEVILSASKIKLLVPHGSRDHSQSQYT